MSLKLAESINQSCFLEDKLQYFEQKDRENSLKEGRSSALNKIKKIISTKDSSEGLVSFEKLEQKNRELQADNSRLKETLRNAEGVIEKMKITSLEMAN